MEESLRSGIVKGDIGFSSVSCRICAPSPSSGAIGMLSEDAPLTTEGMRECAAESPEKIMSEEEETAAFAAKPDELSAAEAGRCCPAKKSMWSGDGGEAKPVACEIDRRCAGGEDCAKVCLRELVVWADPKAPGEGASGDRNGRTSLSSRRTDGWSTCPGAIAVDIARLGEACRSSRLAGSMDEARLDCDGGERP